MCILGETCALRLHLIFTVCNFTPAVANHRQTIVMVDASARGLLVYNDELYLYKFILNEFMNYFVPQLHCVDYLIDFT